MIDDAPSNACCVNKKIDYTVYLDGNDYFVRSLNEHADHISLHDSSMLEHGISIFTVELLVECGKRFGRDVAALIKTIRQQKSIF